MSVCFISGGIAKALHVTAFTLAWTHSVQKTEWQEDWLVSGGQLVLSEARIKSSGAGIDPPADARLDGGWWRWRPAAVNRNEVMLAHSGAVDDWRLCLGATCKPLHRAIGTADIGPVVMRACPAE